MAESPVGDPPTGPPRHAGLFQFLRFVTVGLMNTAVELIVYNALLAIHNPASLTVLTAYSTLGVGAAIVNSYLWNSRWAFRGASAHHGRSAVRQRLLFVAQALINIGINDAVTVGLSSAFSGWDLIPRVIGQNLAKVIAMGTSSLSSYLMLRWFVFIPAGTRMEAGSAPQTPRQRHLPRRHRQGHSVG